MKPATKSRRATLLAQAANDVILHKLEQQEPETGGIIGMDAEGHVVAPFKTTSMYHGRIDAEGNVTIGIYRDEGAGGG